MSPNGRFRASIVACARWESAYVAEWIAYHANLGFDHVYLYCNDDDPSGFHSALRRMPTSLQAMVTYRPYAGQGRQADMYLDGLRRARPASDWICFLDLDEFIVLKRWGSLHDLLDDLDRRAIDSLHFNWLMYGNNGHDVRPSGSVIENYIRRSGAVDCHTKHISRSACFERQRLLNAGLPFWHGLSDPHWRGFNRCNVLGDPIDPLLAGFPTAMTRYLSDGTRSRSIIETAYVAHFVMKSREDFHIRFRRGTAGNFGGQIKWKIHADEGHVDQILDEMNEVEDLFLVDRAGSAFTDKSRSGDVR